MLWSSFQTFPSFETNYAIGVDTLVQAATVRKIDVLNNLSMHLKMRF